MKICFITSIQALLKYCSLIDRERSCEHLKNLLIGANLEGNGSFEPVDNNISSNYDQKFTIND